MQSETPHDRSKRLYELSKSLYNRRRRALPTRTELDVLIELNQFIRTNDDASSLSAPAPASASASSASTLAWEKELVVKYYRSLFREYAVCDLKKYKTKGIALRWRSETEVMSGIGQQTCSSTRCEHHLPTLLQTSPLPRSQIDGDHDQAEDEDAIDPLVNTTLYEFQVPFAYEEDDAVSKEKTRKNVLVKLILCERCGSKLSYGKRAKDKEERRRNNESGQAGGDVELDRRRKRSRQKDGNDEEESESRRTSSSRRRHRSRS